MNRRTRTWILGWCVLGGIWPLYAQEGATPKLILPDETVPETKPLKPSQPAILPDDPNGKSRYSPELLNLIDSGRDNPAPPETQEGVADPYRKQRVWLHFDYLLQRITNGPIRVPVLTLNGNPNSIAALNEPGTGVLVGGGNRNFDFRGMNGLRLTAGGWLDSEGRFGVEASAFLFSPNTTGYVAQASGLGSVLAIPVNAITPFPGNPAGETSLNPGGAPSSVRISGSTELWGTEANALFVPNPGDDLTLAVLMGGRYMNVREKFELTDVFYDTNNAGTVAVRDSFDTQNHFGGVNLGGQAQWNLGRWQASVTGKVALGVVRQTLNVHGDTVVNGSAFGMANAVFPGGVFSQPSNIGSSSQDRFGVLPEANFRLAFAITPNVRINVGYDALFLNSVLRPGNQIDRNVNVNQSVLFGGGAPASQQPGRMMNDTGLWMQGLSFGVGFSY
ncbi:BBP7 family outer membrane beta-barrel protein [Zavarzinella formosa]|uniref:BBP7 family outer membrane beta-barrel protein n=1 Tax=Zavarzinella formosa TaxID=360055 RepID=UPI0002EE605C|nr:BBP7 family outer membrane beta-barrel protein [Zavarzinella formosa]